MFESLKTTRDATNGRPDGKEHEHLYKKREFYSFVNKVVYQHFIKIGVYLLTIACPKGSGLVQSN